MSPRNPSRESLYSQNAAATYLANLRNNRPARPGGARPLPVRTTVASVEAGQTAQRPGSALSSQHDETNATILQSDSRPTVQPNPMSTTGTSRGRPLVQAPLSLRGEEARSYNVLQPGELKYREMTARELEKQEAHSLREALDQIDHPDDETRIYKAAQQEAADLVWKHLNPQLAELEKSSAYRNPDLPKPRNRIAATREAFERGGGTIGSTKTIAGDQTEHEDCRVEGLRLAKRGSRDQATQEALPWHSNRRHSSGKRHTSSGSSKAIFRNPDDRIYEEPENIEVTMPEGQTAPERPLQSRQGNSLPRDSQFPTDKAEPIIVSEQRKFDRFEIYRNPPSQSRNADYTHNPSVSREATPEVETPKGRAMEIRSEEIRAATSMKRKDRSPKLPTPTAVSDRPGRPIVSFDPTWRPGGESPRTSLDIERTPSKPVPQSVHSAPVVPTISLPDEDPMMPTISVTTSSSTPTIILPEDNAEKAPSISLPDDDSRSGVPRITTGSDPSPKSRPLPSHTQSSPASIPHSSSRHARVPWLARPPTATGATVTCNACQLPIAGRIVTASGSVPGGPKARFHPECFTCFHCSTALECVSFYPEPEAACVERSQQDPEFDPIEMRFFCHLDYHDLFSPRCASCKTPIEGAIILAAGKSWHEGHFFCAECGDPFSSTSPFVEDKGYAYCVSCHTKRTSARCRACKKQILDEVTVEALGGKYHEECFRCDECQGDFGEEGRFFIREVEIELTEKEKRKGIMSKKIEERAVCHRCEELRLRRADVFL